MSVVLPQILRDNMDKWEYDDDGKMKAVKGASFNIIKAIDEMNKLENQSGNDDVIIDD